MQITIEYGVIVNSNTGHGWLPYLSEDGRLQCNTWSSRVMSRKDALVAADAMAHSAAKLFVGDYVVRTVCIGEVTI